MDGGDGQDDEFTSRARMLIVVEQVAAWKASDRDLDGIMAELRRFFNARAEVGQLRMVCEDLLEKEHLSQISKAETEYFLAALAADDRDELALQQHYIGAERALLDVEAALYAGGIPDASPVATALRPELDDMLVRITSAPGWYKKPDNPADQWFHLPTELNKLGAYKEALHNSHELGALPNRTTQHAQSSANAEELEKDSAGREKILQDSKAAGSRSGSGSGLKGFKSPYKDDASKVKDEQKAKDEEKRRGTGSLLVWAQPTQRKAVGDKAAWPDDNGVIAAGGRSNLASLSSQRLLVDVAIPIYRLWNNANADTPEERAAFEKMVRLFKELKQLFRQYHSQNLIDAADWLAQKIEQDDGQNLWDLLDD